MLVYDGTKKDFLKSVEDDTIAITIEKNILNKMNRHTTKNEFESWDHSLQYMYKVLNDEEIPMDSGIAIEYNIPQTSKRVDFLISGYDKNNKENVIIIELKQWQKLTAIEGKDALVETYTGNALRCVVHPSYQAWSYSAMINDYNEYVQKTSTKLHPCSYLHNYIRDDNDPLDSKQYKPYLDEAPAFTKGQVNKLRDFIKKAIFKGDNKAILYNIDNGKIKPSKQLQSCIANMIKGNPEFTLIDEQKVVYEQILHTALQSKKDNIKRVIIVNGGPGTGKTVLAINLLAKLTNNDMFVQYVSKNSAPRNVYIDKLSKDYKKSTIQNMFCGSGEYIGYSNNYIDCLLVDEAHRLNEKSGLFKNQGENQIKETINAAKCCVFFLDENQRVTLSDIGSKEEIIKWCNKINVQPIELELQSQFRCNGSNGYLSFIDNALEIKETANFNLDDIDYDFRVIDSPNELRNLIIQKNNESNKARILAGYCWDWLKEGRNDSNFHDIKIDDFEMSWNLNNTQTYAIDDSSINEVGCVHTTQGLEFDYVGVIIGNDMRYDNKIITDFNKRASTDQSLKGIKSMYKKDPNNALKVADEIIKNTYRTLMTRGMKGCYIYCCDKNLQEYFKNLIKNKK